MQDPEDLSFGKGDTLHVVEKHEEQWWRAQHSVNLRIGTIPVNYVEEIPLPDDISNDEKVVCRCAVSNRTDARSAAAHWTGGEDTRPRCVAAAAVRGQ